MGVAAAFRATIACAGSGCDNYYLGGLSHSQVAEAVVLCSWDSCGWILALCFIQLVAGDNPGL